MSYGEEEEVVDRDWTRVLEREGVMASAKELLMTQQQTPLHLPCY